MTWFSYKSQPLFIHLNPKKNQHLIMKNKIEKTTQISYSVFRKIVLIILGLFCPIYTMFYTIAYSHFYYTFITDLIVLY